MSSTTEQIEWLHLTPVLGPIRGGVDRASGSINGVIISEVGHFKDGRGQFTIESLNRIVELGNSELGGLKCYWMHAGDNDDIDAFLGRLVNFRIEGQRVRADLHFDPTAMDEPIGGGKPRGVYLMNRVEADPSSLGMSPHLAYTRQDAPDNGPDVWIPVELRSVDVVREGAATHSFLQTQQMSRDEIKRLFIEFTKEGVTETMSTEPTREEFDALSASVTAMSEVLGNIAKGTEALSEAVLSMKGDAEEKKSKETRAEAIVAKCKMANCSDRADEFIANAELSVEDVTAKLFAEFCDGNQLATAGDDTDEKDETAKLAAEYDQHAKLHEKMGVKRDDYIKHRLNTPENVERSSDGTSCVIHWQSAN